MKMINKIALCLSTTFISCYAYADIIELDAFNPDHCRQQILKSTDRLPIIASYSSDSNDKNSAEFMQKYEQAAKAHPDRTFFKWDASKDMLHSAQALCLQQLGFAVQPMIVIPAVIKDQETGEPMMSSVLRLAWAGNMSVAAIEKFINMSDPALQKALSKRFAAAK